MKVGVSLSPGGLLLPYHVGVLESLEYNGFIKPETPIAGSSAGAIATATHALRVNGKVTLEATIDISERCKVLGGARGRLLPLLEQKLQEFVTEEAFQNMQERPGVSAIAYREVFPNNRPIFQSQFSDRQDLIRAVLHSSMFPFFTTNWPVKLDTSQKFPRLLVDGWFTVPRERCGCPDFAMNGIDVDRTVTISPFPQDVIGLKASNPEDCISPSVENEDTAGRLFRIATQATSREELTSVYEAGWRDAEEWYYADLTRSKEASKQEGKTLLN
jgi:hypothetical protein